METPRQPDTAAHDEAESIQIDYSGMPSVDQSVWEAFASKGVCRMRVQPQLLMQVEGKPKSEFRGWRQVYWTVATKRPEEMIVVRDCLELVFRLLQKLKGTEVKGILKGLLEQAEGDPAPTPQR